MHTHQRGIFTHLLPTADHQTPPLSLVIIIESSRQLSHSSSPWSSLKLEPLGNHHYDEKLPPQLDPPSSTSAILRDADSAPNANKYIAVEITHRTHSSKPLLRCRGRIAQPKWTLGRRTLPTDSRIIYPASAKMLLPHEHEISLSPLHHRPDNPPLAISNPLHSPLRRRDTRYHGLQYRPPPRRMVTRPCHHQLHHTKV